MESAVSMTRKVLDGLYSRKDYIPYKLLEFEDFEREILSGPVFHKQEGPVSDVLSHDLKLRTDLRDIHRAHGTEVARRFLDAAMKHFWKQQMYTIGVYLSHGGRLYKARNMLDLMLDDDGYDARQHLKDPKHSFWDPELGKDPVLPIITTYRPSPHPVTRLCQSMAAYTDYTGFGVGIVLGKQLQWFYDDN